MQSVEHIDFQQYLLAIKRRWRLATATFGFVVAITGAYTLLQKPIYQATGKVLIRQPSNVSLPLNTGADNRDLSSVGSQSDPLGTEIELIRSTGIAQKAIAKLNHAIAPQEFLDRLSVAKLPQADILEISYQSTYPEEAAASVNQVINIYLDSDVSSYRSEAAATRQFILRQLPQNEAIVRQAAMNLRQFEENHNIVNLDEEAKSAVKAIGNLEEQINTSQAKLADVIAQLGVLRKNLSGMNSQAAVAAGASSQSPGVQRALEEFQKIENELTVARTVYRELHPKIADLENKKIFLQTLLKQRVGEVSGQNQIEKKGNLQLGELKQKIIADLIQLETGRSGLASQVSTLSRVLANYRQRVNVLPQLKQREQELERELQAAQSTYEILLRRLEEIRVEENRNIGNARLIEQAVVPAKPIAPNILRNLVLGNILGILLAIAVALLLDLFDTSIKTVKEARELFGYTLLGLIPDFKKFEKTTTRNKGNRESGQYAARIVVRDTPCCPINEAYQMLKANLSYLCSEEPKAIVVTSSVPQEGKSTVSANLALAMAQSERRVLLVDADMRQPVQHKIWELLNNVGLSDVLVGQAELTTTIKAVMPNLHVLTAGVIPPNPMNLLESKRMASLIENFANQYDFVIVDTPSLSIAADAPILSKMVDGILLVSRPGVVDSASATTAKEFLQQTGQNVLGLVINATNIENKHFSSYYANEYSPVENAKNRVIEVASS